MELIGCDAELICMTRPGRSGPTRNSYRRKFVFDDEGRRGMAVDSMVSGGDIISGALVRHSLLFSNVVVDSYSLVQDAVILPNVSIGQHCRLTRVVVDKGCHIPDGTVIAEDPGRTAAVSCDVRRVWC